MLLDVFPGDIVHIEYSGRIVPVRVTVVPVTRYDEKNGGHVSALGTRLEWLTPDELEEAYGEGYLDSYDAPRE